jgi:MFS family permease
MNSKTNEKTTTPRKGMFYGWWMVVAGTIVFVISSGIGFYCNGVFLDPLIQLHGWSKGSVSLAITLFFFTIGIIGLIFGKKIDQYGPKPVLIFGSIVMGAALILLSQITAKWQLYTVYLIMALGYGCTGLLPVNTLITNWFIKRRGFAMSITMTGLSIGGIIFVPFSAYLIVTYGFKIALPILGIVYMAVVIPISMLVIKQRPSDIGEEPDGDNGVMPEEGDEALLSYVYQTQTQTWTRIEAMRTLAFWSIVVAFFLSMSGQVAYLMHQMSFLSQSLGVAGAATAVSITAGASVIGRLLLGLAIDRLEKRYAIMIIFLIQGTAVFSLAYSNHIAVLYLGTFAFGLTMGANLMMQSLITGECFGIVSFATVTGVSGAFINAGAALGPVIAGFIYDITQSYQAAFTIFAAASMLAIFAIVFAKPPKKV